MLFQHCKMNTFHFFGAFSTFYDPPHIKSSNNYEWVTVKRRHKHPKSRFLQSSCYAFLHYTFYLNINFNKTYGIVVTLYRQPAVRLMWHQLFETLVKMFKQIIPSIKNGSCFLPTCKINIFHFFGAFSPF